MSTLKLQAMITSRVSYNSCYDHQFLTRVKEIALTTQWKIPPRPIVKPPQETTSDDEIECKEDFLSKILAKISQKVETEQPKRSRSNRSANRRGEESTGDSTGSEDGYKQPDDSDDEADEDVEKTTDAESGSALSLTDDDEPIVEQKVSLIC